MRSLRPPEKIARQTLSYWRRRIFRNSYTRDGRRFHLRHWSVKIQHDAVRRLFSLEAPGREAAAIEARMIHQTILEHGWAAVPRETARPSAAALGKRTGPGPVDRGWRPRLALRRYCCSTGLTPLNQFSVRVEHDGLSRYFPLGTLDEARASARARHIHEAVVAQGWERAGELFAREVTVAVHWSDNPLAWTYTTLHTNPGPARLEPSASSRTELAAVAVLDTDSSLRGALASWLDRDAGLGRVTSLPVEALPVSQGGKASLCLVNQNLLTALDLADGGPLRSTAGDRPVLFYSVHEDSEELFKSSPGGARGYLFKRTAPGRLLEPIEGIWPAKGAPPEAWSAQVRHYFHELISGLGRTQAKSAAAKLTAREHEVLGLLSKGCLDKEIARHLEISAWTVHGHLKRIFGKLGVHTRTEAVVWYLEK